MKIFLLFLIIISSNIEAKTGVLDLYQVISSHKKYEKFKEKLSREIDKNQERLEEKEADFIKELSNLNKQKDILSKKALEKKEEDLNKKQQELIVFKSKLQKEIEEKDLKFQKEILEDILKKLEKYNDKIKYEKIIDLNNSPYLIIRDSVDITKDFIKYLKSN